jgi:hypothetical protein
VETVVGAGYRVAPTPAGEADAGEPAGAAGTG